MKRKKPIRNAPKRGKRGRPPQDIVAKREREEQQQELVRRESLYQLAVALIHDSLRKHHDNHEIRNRLRWTFIGLHLNITALDDWLKTWGIEVDPSLINTVKAQVIPDRVMVVGDAGMEPTRD